VTGRLDVDLEGGLRAYLADHDGAVTVRGATRHGCCGGTVLVPVADAGPPEDTQGHALVERDGIRVFVERRLLPAATTRLRIGVEGFGRWRRLWLEGLEARID